MVSSTKNGRATSKRNGRPNTRNNDHQRKTDGSKREKITVWVQPEVYDRIINQAIEQNRTISSTAAPFLSDVIVKSEREFEKNSTAKLKISADQIDHIRRVAALEGKSIADCIMGRMGVRVADVEPSRNGTSNGHHPPVEEASNDDASSIKRPCIGRSPSHPDGPGEMQNSPAAVITRPQLHRHPIGDLYRLVCKMNERAAKVLKAVHRMTTHHEDDLHYFLEAQYDHIGHAHTHAQTLLLMEAFDCYMQTVRSVFEESDMAYARLSRIIENADENHSGLHARCQPAATD